MDPLKVFPFLALFATFLFTACGPDFHFQEEKAFPESGWTYSDSVYYEVAIPDTTQLYDLILKVEHSTTFPRQNLYVRISTGFPDGNRLSKEVSLELANKAGQWFGDCDADNCVYELLIQENAFFNEVGTYTFTIEQFTRINPLPGVSSIQFGLLKKGSLNDAS